MKRHGLATTGVALLLLVLGAGCPKPASWEIIEEALAPESTLDAAEVHQELQRGQKRAEEEIAENPKAVRSYVTKSSVLWMQGDHPAAVETLHTALERAKPETDAEAEELKVYLLAAYLRAGTPEMLKKGMRVAQDFIQTEGTKNPYCYYMGLYNRELYRLLGDGVYKTEANRWFLATRLEPQVVEELKKEGLYDPLLE